MPRRALFLGLLFCVTTTAFAGTGRVLIINNDPINIGFNDPTPAAPVGGNDGTTLGAQRLNVFKAAAERWQNALDTNVDIRVAANFSPIPGCTASEAVLGQASPMVWVHDFEGSPRSNVWYPIALANKFSNFDLRPDRDDIFTQFNASVDNDTCLGASNWYYGLDGNKGNHIDLFVVVLHELAHGLGISGATAAPEFREGLPAIFDTHTLDTVAGLTWEEMTPEQRRVSAVNTGNVVWNGPNVRDMASRFLVNVTTLSVPAPSPIANDYEIGLAQFGPQANRVALSGDIVRAADEANTTGPTATDGCTAYTNASAVSGKIALVDRGTCTFVIKARNAQAAGAKALLVVDNNRETCIAPEMSGNAPDVAIPVFSVTIDDGERIKTQLASTPVSASLRTQGRLAGASRNGGFVRLYAPCTLEPGSSIHHWDITAIPNLLMEPSVSSDLLHGLDLTLYQLLDIGWSLPPRTGRFIGKR